MEIKELISQPCGWLKLGGLENDVVISSRIRLARNIYGFPFLTTADLEQVLEIEQFIEKKIKSEQKLANYAYFTFNQLSLDDIYFLFERHLISKEHCEQKQHKAIFFERDETVSVMVNEEDHLRIQVLSNGFCLSSLWPKINHLEEMLEKILNFSFHEKFGYLTVCPSNVGTGLRASVMLHLPGLRITNQMDKIYQSMAKKKFGFRGFYGEGTASVGDFFQLSNQISLGKSECEIIEELELLIPQIIRHEKNIRQNMLEKNYDHLLGLVHKTCLRLANAAFISSEQAMQELSIVRLAIYLQILPVALTMEQLNQIFILCQPFHLQKKEGRELTSEERDRMRAKILQSYFKIS